jgi:hypothetical protein
LILEHPYPAAGREEGGTVQTTHLETERRAPPFTPEHPRINLVGWSFVAVVSVILLTVGAWFLVDYLTPTDSEAMLRDFVADWERADYADLPHYFALNGLLVNTTTGISFAPEGIPTEMTRLVGDAPVDVHNLTMGSSDRIATAQFDVVPEAGDALDGVAVWETVGGEIRQLTISYVTVYEPRS